MASLIKEKEENKKKLAKLERKEDSKKKKVKKDTAGKSSFEETND
jgi:hypothetical protein